MRAGQPACAECPAGSYTSAAGTQCTQCASGKFKSNSSTVCMDCSPGMAAPVPGAEQCEQCLQNAAPNNMKTSCDCNSKFYKLSGICVPCPQGAECETALNAGVLHTRFFRRLTLGSRSGRRYKHGGLVQIL